MLKGKGEDGLKGEDELKGEDVLKVEDVLKAFPNRTNSNNNNTNNKKNNDIVVLRREWNPALKNNIPPIRRDNNYKDNNSNKDNNENDNNNNNINVQKEKNTILETILSNCTIKFEADKEFKKSTFFKNLHVTKVNQTSNTIIKIDDECLNMTRVTCPVPRQKRDFWKPPPKLWRAPETEE